MRPRQPSVPKVMRSVALPPVKRSSQGECAANRIRQMVTWLAGPPRSHSRLHRPYAPSSGVLGTSRPSRLYRFKDGEGNGLPLEARGFAHVMATVEAGRLDSLQVLAHGSRPGGRTDDACERVVSAHRLHDDRTASRRIRASGRVPLFACADRGMGSIGGERREEWAVHIPRWELGCQKQRHVVHSQRPRAHAGVGFPLPPAPPGVEVGAIPWKGGIPLAQL